jgi:hypothetical protein
MTTLTLIVLAVSHYKYNGPLDTQSPFCSWKVASYLFQTAWLWNMGISIIFWLVLWPNYSHDFPLNLGGVLTYLDHCVPLTLTTIEWFLNGIRFELRAFWL